MKRMPTTAKRKSTAGSRSRPRAGASQAKSKPRPRAKQKTTLTEEQQKAYREFEHAVGYVYKKDYARAKNALETLMQKRASDRDLIDRVRVYLNVCEARLGGTTRRQAGDAYMQALVEYNEGEYEKAIELLSNARGGGADRSSVLYLHACAHLAHGNREEGLKLLRDAVQLDPDNRYRALNDPDLEEIRTDDDFLDALGDEEIGA
jgi:tetratricopeptide (TPR) repeat protein